MTVTSISNIDLENTFSELRNFNPVVVFDIDNTLALGYDLCDKSSELRDYPDSEANGFIYMEYRSNTVYFFRPHWKVVFEYLLKNNCTIVIFSASVEGRNKPLMDSFFTDMFGEVEYQKLKSEGQFEVFSQQHTTDCLLKRKCLKSILKPHQCIENTILIDDLSSVIVEGETEYIPIEEDVRYNSVSYVLGLFMTYFEALEHENKSIRQFVGEMNLRVEAERYKYVAKGLSELRQTYPDVIYHNKSVPHWYSDFPDDQLRSNEYLEEVLTDLNSVAPRRKAYDGTMTMLRRQLNEYYVKTDLVVSLLKTLYD